MKTNYKLIKVSYLGGRPCIANIIELSVHTIIREFFRQSDYLSVDYQIHKKRN